MTTTPPPILIPDDEVGAVYQAVDRVLYTRMPEGWMPFGTPTLLPLDFQGVHEGGPMYKLLDAQGKLTTHYKEHVASNDDLFTR